LEFGSGESAVALARAAASVGGTVLSIEQDKNYLERTAELVSKAALDTHVKLIHAELTATSFNGLSTLCYDFNAGIRRSIQELAPDIVIVDGPSQMSGSRLAVAPEVQACLSSSATMFLDDSFRDAELDVLWRWKTHAHIDVQGILPIGNGLAVINIGV
jgi:methyltransferase family protein